MDESRQQHWPRAVMLLGVVYVVIGLTFGALAAAAALALRRRGPT